MYDEIKEQALYVVKFQNLSWNTWKISPLRNYVLPATLK